MYLFLTRGTFLPSQNVYRGKKSLKPQHYCKLVVSPSLPPSFPPSLPPTLPLYLNAWCMCLPLTSICCLYLRENKSDKNKFYYIQNVLLAIFALEIQTYQTFNIPTARCLLMALSALAYITWAGWAHHQL